MRLFDGIERRRLEGCGPFFEERVAALETETEKQDHGSYHDDGFSHGLILRSMGKSREKEHERRVMDGI
jgi:hypothetical protein